MSTTYEEVRADDRDVALYLVHRLDAINIWSLPLNAWVAKQDGEIVAVLIFTNVSYPALHFLVAHPERRPFMRLMKLWLMAYAWLKAIGMPIICAPVYAELHHFQSLLRRFGFRQVGIEKDKSGKIVEHVYAFHFNEEKPHADPVRTDG